MKEARRKLTSYYTFFIVRDPIDRLVSAFRNKFHSNYRGSDVHFKPYARAILRQNRRHISREALARLDDMRFSEFIKYLLSRPPHFNSHWEMYHKLCQPCAIKYDFIGKYETMSQDVSYVLERIGVNISFPQRYQHSTFPKMYLTGTSRADLRKIRELYAMDYELFGYKFHIPDSII